MLCCCNVVEMRRQNNAEERKRFQIVDVRETAELALSKLPDEKVVHLPMSQAQQWAETVAEPDNDIIDHDKPVVCLVCARRCCCH